MRIWVVKHLRDLGSGKPETDVLVVGQYDASEDQMREYVLERWPGALPWDCEEDEAPRVWSLGDPRHPDGFIELEDREVGQWTPGPGDIL